MAAEKDVADRVIFAGKTTDPYSAFYRAADFFILPTRHDPCSLVVLEALAMGLPVISTVFNGSLRNHGNRQAWIRPPRPGGCFGGIADAYRQFLNDSTRRLMAENCLALRPRLAYERHIDELLEIYRSSK